MKRLKNSFTLEELIAIAKDSYNAGSLFGMAWITVKGPKTEQEQTEAAERAAKMFSEEIVKAEIVGSPFDRAMEL